MKAESLKATLLAEQDDALLTQPLLAAIAEYQRNQQIESAYQVVMELQTLFERFMNDKTVVSEIPVIFPDGAISKSIIQQNNEYNYETMDLEN